MDLRLQILEDKLNNLVNNSNVSPYGFNKLLPSTMSLTNNYYRMSQLYPSSSQLYQPPPPLLDMPTHQLIEKIRREERKKGIRIGMKKAQRHFKLIKNNYGYINQNNENKELRESDEFSSLRSKKLKDMMINKRNRWSDNYSTRSCDDNTSQGYIEKLINTSFKKIEMQQKKDFERLKAIFEKELIKEEGFEIQRKQENKTTNNRGRKLDMQLLSDRDKGRNSVKKIREFQKGAFDNDYNLNSDSNYYQYMGKFSKYIDSKIQENERKKELMDEKDEHYKKLINDTITQKITNHLQNINIQPKIIPQTNQQLQIDSTHSSEHLILPQIKPESSKTNTINQINEMLKKKMEEKIALEKTKKELELEMMLEEEISDNELERFERIKKMESLVRKEIDIFGDPRRRTITRKPRNNSTFLGSFFKENETNRTKEESKQIDENSSKKDKSKQKNKKNNNENKPKEKEEKGKKEEKGDNNNLQEKTKVEEKNNEEVKKTEELPECINLDKKTKTKKPKKEKKNGEINTKTKKKSKPKSKSKSRPKKKSKKKEKQSGE